MKHDKWFFLALFVGLVINMLAHDAKGDTWYFVASSAGSDSNDGKDPLGLSASGQLSTVAAGIVAFTDVGAFAGYTHVADDIIYIEEDGDAADHGWYTVLSKESDDEIRLTTPPNVGDGVDLTTAATSSDGPWQTLTKVWSTASDKTSTIWLDPNNDHVPTLTLDFSNLQPSGITNYIGGNWTIRGYRDVATIASAQASVMSVSHAATADNTITLIDVSISASSASAAQLMLHRVGDLVMNNVTLTASPNRSDARCILFNLNSSVSTAARTVNATSCSFLASRTGPCIQINDSGHNNLSLGALFSFTDCTFTQSGDPGGQGILMGDRMSRVRIQDCTFSVKDNTAISCTGGALPANNYAVIDELFINSNSITAYDGIVAFKQIKQLEITNNTISLINNYLGNGRQPNDGIGLGDSLYNQVADCKYLASSRLIYKGTGPPPDVDSTAFTSGLDQGTSVRGFIPGDSIWISAGTGATVGEYLLESISSQGAVIYNYADGRQVAAGNLTTGDIAVGYQRSHQDYPIHQAIIWGNTIVFYDEDGETIFDNGGECISIGQAIVADIGWNIMVGGGEGMAYKGSNSRVHHNMIWAKNSILTSEGRGNWFDNNTIIPRTGSSCFSWNNNPASGRPARNNFIYNNYMLAGDGGLRCLKDRADGNHWNMFVDYNVYVASTTSPFEIANFNGTFATLSALQTKWSTNYADTGLNLLGWVRNDTHSIVESGTPIEDFADLDFSLATNSDAVGTGFPSPTDIGAVQVAGSGAAYVAGVSGIHFGGTSVTGNSGSHYSK